MGGQATDGDRRGSGREVRVLLVDDVPGVADTAGEFLERERASLTTTTASSASDGLDRLRAGDIDAVVSDYEMPGMDGLAFLEAVRQDYPELPFILFTGKGSEEIASEAISAGVTDYLQKDTGTEQYELLANRITNAVEQTRVRRELSQYETIVDSAGDGIYMLDAEGRFTEVSDYVLDRSGYDREELLGEHVSRLLPEEDVETGAELIADLLSNPDEDIATYEATVETADGDAFPVELRIALLPTDDGEFRGTVGVARDISERKHAEQRQEALLEATTDVITVLETDGTATYVSPSVEYVLGHDPADLEGTSAFEHIHPDDREDVRATFYDAVEDPEQTPTVEFRFRHADGSWRTLEAVGRNRLETPGIEGFVVTCQDVTERKHRERALERSWRRFEAIFDSPDSFIGILEPDGTLIEANETALEFVGADPGDVAGRPFPEAPWWTHDPDLRDRLQEWIDQAASGEHVRFEASHRAPTGEEITVDGIIRPVTDDGGEIVSLVAEGRDITERKNHERALEQQRTKIEALHDIAVEMESCTTEQAVCDLTVEAAESILEFDVCVVDIAEDGMLPTRAGVGLPPGGTTTLSVEEGIAGKTYRTGESFLVEDTRDAEEAMPQAEYLSALSVPIGDHGVFQAGATAVGAFDGTDLELTELLVSHTAEALSRVARERDLEQYETMVETVADAVYALDAEGRYLFVNRTFEEVTGYDRETVVGQPADALLEAADVERFEGAIMEMLKGEREAAVFEIEIETAAGTTIPVEARITLLPTDDGEFRGTVGVARDISDRKERERELQRQNERLDRFASMVSHDLRNPLNVAIGQLELLRQTGDPEHADEVDRTLDRMAALIEDLLTFARQGRMVEEPTPVDVGTLADAAWETVTPTERDARLRLVDDDLTVSADPDRLRQALENLFANAVDHAGPAVTVAVGRLADGGGFYVADDGPGIPADERDRVFERGYSTGEEGTGFGLSIVREIAEAHGWEIAVDESRDGGARFVITGVELV